LPGQFSRRSGPLAVQRCGHEDPVITFRQILSGPLRYGFNLLMQLRNKRFRERDRPVIYNFPVMYGYHCLVEF
jgi:hypothetical protein